jgi:FkbH-like protein
MVLRLEDVSCFVANWEDKAGNLRTIAERLNIGLGSLVFVDDQPAERSIVRQLAGEVAVPELPADVAGWVQALERHRYFQLVSVNAEDLRRTEMYRANAARAVAAEAAGSVEDFLRSLDMTARIAPVDAANLERAVQLINRSNQFNLTTRRYSAAQVMDMADHPDWITRTVSLADRFGDNGLISVLLARIEGRTLVVDTWLMSCRVLKRGVEDLLLDHLVALARERGIERIRGEYIPTAKNGLAREHYARLGFEPGEADADGHTWWTLPTGGRRPGRPVHIREIGPDERRA